MTTTLTLEQLDIAADLTIGTLDRKLRKTGMSESSKSDIVRAFFLDFYFNRNLHTLLVLRNLESITNSMLENEVVRDFILDAADQMCILLNSSDLSYAGLCEVISNGIAQGKKSPPEDGKNIDSMSLLPTRIQETLYVERDILNRVLIDNPWLVLLIVSFMFLDKSEEMFKMNDADI